MGYFEFFALFQDLCLLVYPIFSRGWETLLQRDRTELTISLIICAISLLSSLHTILPGYFLAVNVQPVNRQFYDNTK